MLSQCIAELFLLVLFALLLGLRYLLVDRYAEKQRLYPVYFVQIIPDDPDSDLDDGGNCWPTELELPVIASSVPQIQTTKGKERVSFALIQEINR